MVQGAAFSVGAQTAYSMVRRLSLVPGCHVAVTAATSNTSLFALKALAARGHIVHAITTSPGVTDHLHGSGARYVHTLPRNDRYMAALLQSLSAQRLETVDAVIDPFCDVYLRKLLPVVRRFGVYATCGVLAQFQEAHDDSFAKIGLGVDEVFNQLIRKSIVLVGNNLGTSSDLSDAAADFQAGVLDIDIDTVLRNGEVGSFVERSFQAPGRCGKVVFEYGPVAQPPAPVRTAVTEDAA